MQKPDVSKKLFLLVAILAFAGSLQAADRAETFQAGAKFYDEGKFKEAAAEYESISDTSGHTANLYYNLGNTWYRLNEPGRAALNYYRALNLEPGASEAAHNLNVVLAKQNISQPLPGWLVYWPPSLTIPIAAVLGALFFWLGLAAWIVRAGHFGFRKAAGVVLMMLAAGFGTALAGHAWAFGKPGLAVVVGAKTEARFAPAESSPVKAKLPPASRVQVLKERGAWIYAELPGRDRGWIPSGSVEKIVQAD